VQDTFQIGALIAGDRVIDLYLSQLYFTVFYVQFVQLGLYHFDTAERDHVLDMQCHFLKTNLCGRDRERVLFAKVNHTTPLALTLFRLYLT
jgi:hypothetical protein